MGQAQINVRTRACSRTSIARTRQAALTHNVRGKELNKDYLINRNINPSVRDSGFLQMVPQARMSMEVLWWTLLYQLGTGIWSTYPEGYLLLPGIDSFVLSHVHT